MHPAPALSVALHRSQVLRLAAVFISGAAFLLLTWWAGSHWSDDDVAVHALRVLAASVVVLLGGFAWRATRPVQGTLRWDGHDWWLEPLGASARAGMLHLRLDLQRALLLEFVPLTKPASSRESIWLWLSQDMPDMPWHVLRCAVYSPRPESPPASDVAPDAAPGHGRDAANPPPDEHRP